MIEKGVRQRGYVEGCKRMGSTWDRGKGWIGEVRVVAEWIGMR